MRPLPSRSCRYYKFGVWVNYSVTDSFPNPSYRRFHALSRRRTLPLYAFARFCSTATSSPHDTEKNPSTSNSTESNPTAQSHENSPGDAPHAGKEIQFYEDFLLCEKDVHYTLLHEAYVKHGVLLNVPPQLPPSGTPPEVPEVMLPAAQVERMRGLKLAYAPTHLPPPLHTAGTRQLIIDETATAVDTTTTTTTTSTTSVKVTKAGKGSGGAVGSTTTIVVRRLPPDPAARFHCSLCGKSFRLQLSADHHVKFVHPNDTNARVAEGPGAGEIMEEAETMSRAATTHTTTPSPPQPKTSPPSNTPPPESLVALSGQGKGAPDDKSLSVGVKAGTTVYTKATLTLPPDDLVDALLKEVWDTVAQSREDVPKKNDPNSFVPFERTVEGKADRRQEMEAQGRPSARATPENAAPGIKRPGVLSGGAITAKSRTGHYLPIKELVKKYPNPFGDSPNALLQELENEPLNPFVPPEELKAQLAIARENPHLHHSTTSAVNPLLSLNLVPNLPENGTKTSPMTREPPKEKKHTEEEEEKLMDKLRATRPSLSRAAELRRFVCPLCPTETTASFRLLDALFDHIETVHGETTELSESQLRALYAIQRRSALYPSKEEAEETMDGKNKTNQRENTKQTNMNSNVGTLSDTQQSQDSKDRKEIFGSIAPNGARATDPHFTETIKAALPESMHETVPPPAVERRALSVHLRSSSNTVLLGRITDVQHGFLGATAVTQYVLEVKGEDAVSVSNGSDETSTQATDSTCSNEDSIKESGNEMEKEFIVVRCMGDNFPVALLKDQVKLGSTVFVQGTLRMNRHIDDASKRLHAYPFVQVVPPLGCVKVV